MLHHATFVICLDTCRPNRVKFVFVYSFYLELIIIGQIACFNDRENHLKVTIGCQRLREAFHTSLQCVIILSVLVNLTGIDLKQ